MRRHRTTEPARKCIGCQQSRPQSELIRFTLDGQTVVPDMGMRRDGRGFYLCRSRECLERSLKRKAWNRILRSRADNEEVRKIVEAVLSDTKEDMNVKES